MARIGDENNYDLDTVLTGLETLIGTDTDGSTKRFLISTLADYFGGGGGPITPFTLTSVAGEVYYTGAESTLYEITLTENVNFNFPSAPTANALYRIKITNPGAFTVSFVGNYKFPGGSAYFNGGFSLDVLTILVDGTDVLVLNESKNMGYALM